MSLSFFAVIYLLISAVSGQECADTCGSLSHDSNIVNANQIFILAGYTVPCNGTVVAWEFCYRIANGSVTFYPGIWRITGTMGSNTNYALIQSNSVTYDSSIRTSGVDSCQRVNLSTTDQFTVPAGSVVGLYSNVMTQLLYTNTNSSITTYQRSGNHTSVNAPGNGKDVNYNIAIKVHLVLPSDSSVVARTTSTPVVSVETISDHIAVTPITLTLPTNHVTAVTPTISMVSPSNNIATIPVVPTSIVSTSDIATISVVSTIDTVTVTNSMIFTSIFTSDFASTLVLSTIDTVTVTTSTLSPSIFTSDISTIPVVPTSIVSTSDNATASVAPTIDTVTATNPVVSASSSSAITSVSNITIGATNTHSSSDDEGSSVGIIAGCVIGVVLCITLLLVVISVIWCISRRRKGKLEVMQDEGNIEISAAKCANSQELINSTDSSAYYSTVGNQQPCARQTNNSDDLVYKNVVPDYEFSSGCYGHKNDNDSINSDTLVRNYSKIDYEAIQNPDESAVRVYSNTVKDSTNYDDTILPVYNGLEDVDNTTANDEEEIYSDPGHSEADIYACFEKKRFHMIKRNDVSVSKKLGSGEFGTVHLGLWSNGSADPVQVAVKTLNSQCSESDRVKFLREAAIMGQFEGDNIVRLYGVVTEVRDAMIVLEYMPKGDLQEFLIDLKNKTPPETLNELKHDLLSYCRHVAAGLSLLSSKGFVHRDLAARNILVSSDDVCKIADFGMARDVADDIYYVTSGGKIPVRWTAPEAIFYKKYSVKSDVWSFGCVMYEIWSLGCKPFEEDDIREYIKKISTGYRLPPPPGCPRAIYELMIQCWHPVANKRIDSSSVVKTLQKSDRALLPGAISAKDNEELSTKLGDPLTTSNNLYQVLQNTYLSTTK